MFGRYKIKWSYYEDGQRVKETDIFWGDNAQEAVDTCRAEYLNDFTNKFARIESVWLDQVENWE